MINPQLEHFCIQWFAVQTAAMNSMFRLLGELSHQQTLSIKNNDQLLFDLVTKMRNSIVGVVVDETNLTERTRGYEKVFHNELFRISAKKAGVEFPSIDKFKLDNEVNEFVSEVSKIEGYRDLFAFLRATEHEAEDIFEKMKKLFEKHNAPKEACEYIEIHEKIESLHDDESEEAQLEFNIDNQSVDKYIVIWRKVLEHLELA